MYDDDLDGEDDLDGLEDLDDAGDLDDVEPEDDEDGDLATGRHERDTIRQSRRFNRDYRGERNRKHRHNKAA
jgi:hypothetical protein